MLDLVTGHEGDGPIELVVGAKARGGQVEVAAASAQVGFCGGAQAVRRGRGGCGGLGEGGGRGGDHRGGRKRVGRGGGW